MACYGYINRGHDVIIHCISGLRYFQTNSYWASSLENIGFSFGAYFFYLPRAWDGAYACYMDGHYWTWMAGSNINGSFNEWNTWPVFYNCAYWWFCFSTWSIIVIHSEIIKNKNIHPITNSDCSHSPAETYIIGKREWIVCYFNLLLWIGRSANQLFCCSVFAGHLRVSKIGNLLQLWPFASYKYPITPFMMKLQVHLWSQRWNTSQKMIRGGAGRWPMDWRSATPLFVHLFLGEPAEICLISMGIPGS